jgi:mersacidin/lichenicidin family type 2 lantibiotic
MKRNFDVIRAWKDSEYRATLSAEQLEEIPSNPAGDALSEMDLELIKGSAAADSGGYICSVSAECWGFSCGTYVFC